ncbi:Holliday junction resolvase RuvX [Synechococcus sp. PCC 7336]|uniref:Holliday junction resolvase RuvX n=1 Tax=Synechococcus sp. PCC 7336 TaxID=195250 RepID=UPI000348B957|nr:Holliday junction resolvase RuvX [Synechococcus sp. PCC 7336]
MLIGFDPGREKCGVAIATADGTVLHREIVPSAEVETILPELCQRYGTDPISTPLDLVMGNQTTSRQWRDRLSVAFPKLAIQLVDERFSSREARERYWLLYPPRGLQRLVPKGMRLPPRPVDDIVAAILIERFLNRMGED